MVGKRTISLNKAFYVRTWRGRLVVCKWPEKQPHKQPPEVLARRQKFKDAQLLAQYIAPKQQIVAREVTDGTPLLPRDLLTAAIYGRLFSVTIAGERTIYSVAAAHDVSLNLDALNEAIPPTSP